MGGRVLFPLFVFEKDDCSMFLVEAPDEVLYQAELIDIENDEYVFWDANGNALRISVAGRRVTGMEFGAAEMTLAEAFRLHSDAFDLDVDTKGPFDEVWRRLKEAESCLQENRGLLSRLRRKSP